MEAMVKKYQQRFRKVRDEMDCWDELQARLVSQFRNASSIIQRLQVSPFLSNYYLPHNYYFCLYSLLIYNLEFWWFNQILQDSKNYSGLNEVVGIQEAVLVKQMESLQKILLSMKNTM